MDLDMNELDRINDFLNTPQDHFIDCNKMVEPSKN